jgi:crotonobetainyl-CoA:carnitine CoA-transferase CaiB-like acyl-CoA transferase
MNVFAGIKVLDIASFVAGPMAATIMADFGADVIKIRAARGRRLSPHASTAEPAPKRAQLRLGAGLAQQARAGARPQA